MEAQRDGHDFEYYCAELLRRQGYKKVKVTPGSGDQGVDILAEKDGLRFAVQCKYYSSKVGNTPVQEVFTGKAYYNCDIAIVMTNSYFTKGAIELANATDVILWDYDDITRFERSCEVDGDSLWIVDIKDFVERRKGVVLFVLFVAVLALLMLWDNYEMENRTPISLEILQAEGHPKLYYTFENVERYYQDYKNVSYGNEGDSSDNSVISFSTDGGKNIENIYFSFNHLPYKERDSLELDCVLDIVSDYIPDTLYPYYDLIFSIQYETIPNDYEDHSSEEYVCYYGLNGTEQDITAASKDYDEYLVVTISKDNGEYYAHIDNEWNGYDTYFQRFDEDFINNVVNLQEWGWQPF